MNWCINSIMDFAYSFSVVTQLGLIPKYFELNSFERMAKEFFPAIINNYCRSWEYRQQ